MDQIDQDISCKCMDGKVVVVPMSITNFSVYFKNLCEADPE